jgi:hypothetical protein
MARKLPLELIKLGTRGRGRFLWHWRPAHVPEALNAKPTFELQSRVSRPGFPKETSAGDSALPSTGGAPVPQIPATPELDAR